MTPVVTFHPYVTTPFRSRYQCVGHDWWEPVPVTGVGSSATVFSLNYAVGTLGASDTVWVVYRQPLDPKVLRQRQLLAWTREAIQAAREALRATDDDPSGLLARRPRREASRRLHAQPRFRGRICSGSSRYRVMRS